MFGNTIHAYKLPADLLSAPPDHKPLIVIGTGPVGMMAAHEARGQQL